MTTFKIAGHKIPEMSDIHAAFGAIGFSLGVCSMMLILLITMRPRP